jgi:hypothetical protein
MWNHIIPSSGPNIERNLLRNEIWHNLVGRTNLADTNKRVREDIDCQDIIDGDIAFGPWIGLRSVEGCSDIAPLEICGEFIVQGSCVASSTIERKVVWVETISVRTTEKYHGFWSTRRA